MRHLTRVKTCRGGGKQRSVNGGASTERAQKGRRSTKHKTPETLGQTALLKDLDRPRCLGSSSTPATRSTHADFSEATLAEGEEFAARCQHSRVTATACDLGNLLRCKHATYLRRRLLRLQAAQPQLPTPQHPTCPQHHLLARTGVKWDRGEQAASESEGSKRHVNQRAANSKPINQANSKPINHCRCRQQAWQAPR